MATPFHHAHETQARYASMERNAGVMTFILLLLIAVGAVLFRPSIWFILGSVLAGLAMFFCWHAALRQRFGIVVALAIGSVLLALISTEGAVDRTLASMLALGLPPFAFGLYASILAAKVIRKRQSNEV